MICPFATQEPSPNHGGPMESPALGAVIHVTAGESDPGTWFSNPLSQVSSHFGIGNGQGGMADGEIAQYVDTALMSWAQGAGNFGYWSFEFEGEPTEAMTRNQILSGARLYALGVQEEGWPLTIVDTPGERGFITHGDGGGPWGGHTGCPGSIRAAQRAAILYIAALSLQPQPPPQPPQEGSMPVSATVSFKPNQFDVFQVSLNTLWHKYHTPQGWGNEAIASPSGGVSSITATFPDQTPQIAIMGGQCMVTVEDSNKTVWYFAQSATGDTWGANELP